MKIALYRILGNDLPPRHGKEQTFVNLRYILDNEGEFDEVEKVWCLNRIIDNFKKEEIIKLLNYYGKDYFEIPFKLDAYKECNSKESKIMYITNVNQARNACIEDSLKDDSIEKVMPFDGGAYFKYDGLFSVIQNINNLPEDLFYYVPLHRASSIKEIEDIEFMPVTKERYDLGDGSYKTGPREPYIIFDRKADLRFNENLIYPDVDKVELLWKLGMRGPWDYWNPAVREEAFKKPSAFFGQVKGISYVIRLPSYGKGDGSNLERGAAGAAGKDRIIRFLDNFIGRL